jgi:hypothetical protein
MAEALGVQGVTVEGHDLSTIAQSTQRLNTLHQLDFAGHKTAFEHIEGVAAAKTLFNGAPAHQLAAELFTLAGSGREAKFGYWYAGDLHAIYSVHHPGEMCRILASLAVTGAVTVADGQKVEWKPEKLQLHEHHLADSLWHALYQSLKEKDLPPTAVLSDSSGWGTGGKDANITSRLMGDQFVNVDAEQAAPHLEDLVARRGPMLGHSFPYRGEWPEVSQHRASERDFTPWVFSRRACRRSSRERAPGHRVCSRR